VAEVEAAEVAAEPGKTAGAAILRSSAGRPHHGLVDEPVIDRLDVTTLLTVLGDINVNIRAIREILEEDSGEDPEDDA
jgi:hypothetical protein